MPKRIIAILCTAILLISSAIAHPGGTDSKGGHKSSGGYHYHHGYPAHQHENGVCPYDFHNNVKPHSGTSLKSNNSSNTLQQDSVQKKIIDIVLYLLHPEILVMIFIVGFWGYFIGIIVIECIRIFIVWVWSKIK